MGRAGKVFSSVKKRITRSRAYRTVRRAWNNSTVGRVVNRGVAAVKRAKTRIVDKAKSTWNSAKTAYRKVKSRVAAYRAAAQKRAEVRKNERAEKKRKAAAARSRKKQAMLTGRRPKAKPHPDRVVDKFYNQTSVSVGSVSLSMISNKEKSEGHISVVSRYLAVGFTPQWASWSLSQSQPGKKLAVNASYMTGSGSFGPGVYGEVGGGAAWGAATGINIFKPKEKYVEDGLMTPQAYAQGLLVAPWNLAR